MIPRDPITKWTSILSAGLLSLHYGAVGVFKAEDYIEDTFKRTKAAIIDDIAISNGYAPKVGNYTVDEARASLDDIRVYIDDAAQRHFKKSRLTLTQFKKLLASVVLNESTHLSDALSEAGAVGLGQVMPFNTKICGLKTTKQLIDPETNVDCAAQILAANLSSTKGDIDGALALYNWGKLPGGKNGPLPAETAKYIRDVKQDYLS